MSRVSITKLSKMKTNGEKIAVLTCYDASFARLMEDAGVEVLLVGDTLGMVIQGQESTIPTTLKDMLYHTRCVARASNKSLIISDMPFGSDTSPKKALECAVKLLQNGSQMVKLEGVSGNRLTVIEVLTKNAISVCGHLGLLPQSVFQLGGYHVQGRTPEQAQRLLHDAFAIQHAGAQMLVLESVPRQLAEEITLALDIPVIGIGAGPDTDGQVLVCYDILGVTSDLKPKFVKNFLADTGSIAEAIAAYVKAVKEKSFPDKEYSYS